MGAATRTSVVWYHAKKGPGQYGIEDEALKKRDPLFFSQGVRRTCQFQSSASYIAARPLHDMNEKIEKRQFQIVTPSPRVRLTSAACKI
jgi:hypothetical protein